MLAIVACGGAGSSSTGAAPGIGGMGPAAGTLVATTGNIGVPDPIFRINDTMSDLKQLDHMTTIGSTVDPMNGDQNPYGLDVAKISAGKFKAGDLAVCNFNNAANVQGTGTTIIALHPQPGSMPTRVAQDASLLGCDEIALAPDDTIWASAFAANDNPIVSPSGVVLTTLPHGPWHNPFGEAFSPRKGPFGNAAFYVTNAGTGSIVRVNITNAGLSFDIIATGFAVNHGMPGSILGPSGLQYDSRADRLYIVDGTNNTLVAFNGVSSIPEGGIQVHGKSFSGPFAQRARLIFSGPPLNGPISSALLFDGHLVLGNTLDATGKNLMVEISPQGKLLDVKNVDNGVAGALFGMVAIGDNISNTKLYFNDDNTNTVDVLTQ
jgi:hypothetical protein